MKRAVMASVFAGVMLTGSVALAHGGRPIPRSIYLDPFDSNMQTLISSDLGLHTSFDGGQSWFWICEDVVGYDVRDFALAGDGNLTPRERVWLAGGVGITDGENAGEYVDGMYRSLDGGCNWEPVGGILAGQWVSAISVDPTDPNKVVVTTRHLLEPNGIAYSDDAGETWAWSNIQGEPRRLDSMVRSTSDPAILYASATNRLLHSEDGGRTWESFFEDLPSDMTDELAVHIVDPEDPDVLYFSLLGLPGRHLYVTTDGGETYRKLLEPSGLDFQGVAVVTTDDAGGRSILVGDTFGTAFLSTDLGETWEEYLSGVVSIECLTPIPGQEGDLFVCSNPFAQFVQPVFALGTTTDNSRTVEPHFAYGDTADYLQCDDDSQIQQVCVALMDIGGDDAGPGIPDAGFDVGFPDTGPDNEDAGPPDSGDPMDAGMPANAGTNPTPKGDCNCHTPAAPVSGGGAIFFLSLLALLRVFVSKP